MENERCVARRRRDSARSLVLVRWLGIAVVLAICAAYVQPIRSYFHARDDLARQRQLHSALLDKQAVLRHRLELVETDDFLAREARRIGLVRPGEHLYIVRGLGPTG
jgi:hypothetical protein